MEISATLSIHGRSPTPKQAINVSKDWNLIIKHQTKLKNDHAILSTYTQMESLGIAPDSATMPLVLKACGRLNAIEKGVRIHSCIRDSDLIRDVRVGTALVDFYSKCGLVGEASKVFDEMPERDLVSWNALISGYVGCSCYKEAVLLFMEMQKAGLTPNSRTVVPLLLACAEMLELRLGHEIHGYCLRNGLFDMDAHVGTALIGFYMRFDAAVSHRVFSLMEVRNVVSWNAMITGYLNIGDYTKALKLFSSMLTEGIKFDAVTMLLVIQACAESESLQLGMQLHQLAIKFNFVDDLFVLNALLNMYSDNGRLESSCALFNAVPTSDAALWNSMISAYIAFGFHAEAIALYIKMRLEGLKEDKRTVAIMLSLCEDLNDGSIWGRGLHAHAMKSGMELDVFLGNALLSMYVEHNQIDAAQKLFDKMRGLDVISWNTMILALAQRYGMHGRGHDATLAFAQMLDDGFKPNNISFVSVLSACSHSGLTKTGLQLFSSMVRDFGIAPQLAHYGCIVDLLGRGGHFAEAIALISSMPVEPDASIWRALLSSCQVKSNKKLVETIFRKLVELEPSNPGNFVLLSNVYAAAGLWSEVSQIRKWVRDKGLVKPPGTSWIVIGSQVHYFTATDVSHPQSEEIYENLNSLTSLIQDMG
ncbi:pentatricopeptide repeat-containing protein At3g03580-like isoform X2 [Cucurbita pepo subsp. pepo]|uniref:pentatricopeptide repeat-containing protein At3g03580-like isoform X2 n=1 Tax=Cucurbita pepo subsp. pepo TaxID=3664 RepID=UPI000C9D342E|nr:pentatricopeptide repeat-containing protein At3g03580-like isoform X2 [Cucurbita pepo subsp. pepo]